MRAGEAKRWGGVMSASVEEAGDVRRGGAFLAVR
jgi:hypothetical protein